jgi:hypothetical protein
VPLVPGPQEPGQQSEHPPIVAQLRHLGWALRVTRPAASGRSPGSVARSQPLRLLRAAVLIADGEESGRPGELSPPPTAGERPQALACPRHASPPHGKDEVMNHATKRSAGTALALAALAPAAALAASAGAAGTARGSAPAEVQVNQAGYPLASPKVAFVMLPHRAAGVSYTVSGAHGTVFRGWSAHELGGWNRRSRAVYAPGFTGLTRPGRYRVTVRADGQTAASLVFAIAPAPVLYHRLVYNGIRYFISERDGAGVVPTVLHRQPANLTDRRAFVYRDPRYGTHDNLPGTLHRTGEPVNVAGGWFDAGGGYEKFAYTASYADGLLLLAARDSPGQYAGLADEARFGLRWLQKLWRPAARVLYIQVGIGTGNASNTIQGDDNFWFLPQAEDHLNAVAARWARAYPRQGHRPGGDTLNLYDNGAPGKAELLQAMRRAGGQA